MGCQLVKVCENQQVVVHTFEGKISYIFQDRLVHISLPFYKIQRFSLE